MLGGLFGVNAGRTLVFSALWVNLLTSLTGE